MLPYRARPVWCLHTPGAARGWDGLPRWGNRHVGVGSNELYQKAGKHPLYINELPPPRMILVMHPQASALQKIRLDNVITFVITSIMKTKLRKIGNSYGIILSQEAVDKLCVKEGESLYLAETPDNALRITKSSPEFERTMKLAREGMKQYHNALTELAK